MVCNSEYSKSLKLFVNIFGSLSHFVISIEEVCYQIRNWTKAG